MASYSRPGNPYDNAQAEAGWSTLKTELLPHGTAFASLEEARLEVAHYLDTYFNLDRRHSALGYCSPHQFEQNLKNPLPLAHCPFLPDHPTHTQAFCLMYSFEKKPEFSPAASYTPLLPRKSAQPTTQLTSTRLPPVVTPAGIGVKDPVTKIVYPYAPGQMPPAKASAFVQQTFSSLNYIARNGDEFAQDILLKLVNTTYFYLTIVQQKEFGPEKTGYQIGKQLIEYNPAEGLIVGDGRRQSPTLGLLHELDHAATHMHYLLQKKALRPGSRESPKSINLDMTMAKLGLKPDENRIVKGVEKSNALKWKQGVRSNYTDVIGVYKAIDPNLTDQAALSLEEQKRFKKIADVIADKKTKPEKDY